MGEENEGRRSERGGGEAGGKKFRERDLRVGVRI